MSCQYEEMDASVWNCTPVGLHPPASVNRCVCVCLSGTWARVGSGAYVRGGADCTSGECWLCAEKQFAINVTFTRFYELVCVCARARVRVGKV